MSEWFEDEAFWDGLYPFMFSDRKFEVADDQVADILDLAGLEGGSVLDLACGPGRHAAALAKRGFRVTGVDLSLSLLRRARDRARAEGVDVEWVQEDMRRFVRPDSFDLAINIFTAFGYFDDRQDDLQVLRNIHLSLRKGAAFVIEVMSKECLARHFLPTTSEGRQAARSAARNHRRLDPCQEPVDGHRGWHGNDIPVPAHRLLRPGAEGPPAWGWVR